MFHYLVFTQLTPLLRAAVPGYCGHLPFRGTARVVRESQGNVSLFSITQLTPLLRAAVPDYCGHLPFRGTARVVRESQGNVSLCSIYPPPLMRAAVPDYCGHLPLQGTARVVRESQSSVSLFTLLTPPPPTEKSYTRVLLLLFGGLKRRWGHPSVVIHSLLAVKSCTKVLGTYSSKE